MSEKNKAKDNLFWCVVRIRIHQGLKYLTDRCYHIGVKLNKEEHSICAHVIFNLVCQWLINCLANTGRAFLEAHLTTLLCWILIWFYAWFFFSKMVEMVCLHVISLMEALQECNSTIFVKVGIPYREYLLNYIVWLIWFVNVLSCAFPPTQKKREWKKLRLNVNATIYPTRAYRKIKSLVRRPDQNLKFKFSWFF